VQLQCQLRCRPHRYRADPELTKAPSQQSGERCLFVSDKVDKVDIRNGQNIAPLLKKPEKPAKNGMARSLQNP
jgi:hypothetical protein